MEMEGLHTDVDVLRKKGRIFEAQQKRDELR
jgi:hypothetical protein